MLKFLKQKYFLFCIWPVPTALQYSSNSAFMLQLCYRTDQDRLENWDAGSKIPKKNVIFFQERFKSLYILKPSLESRSNRPHHWHFKYNTCLYIRQLPCCGNTLLSFLLLALCLFLQIAVIQKAVTLPNLWRTINASSKSVPKSIYC